MKEKPVCRRCNLPHWPFIRCDGVDAENAREADKAAAEAKARVVPQPRTHPARQNTLVVSRNFVQQAPGVYRRRRRAA